MSILGIDQVTYGASDLAACRQCFIDWGLALLIDDGQQLVFESLNGCRVVVADPVQVVLPRAIEDGPTLREVVWGVQSSEDLDRLRPLLAAQPGYRDEWHRIGCTDPMGLAVCFQVSTKRVLTAADASGGQVNNWHERSRINAAGKFYDRARPVEVGHVVLFTPELAAMEAFYSSLGFVTSDRYPGRGAFMRCAPRGGHHDLFLLQTPDGRRGLNHVAFSVRDIHEVFGGGLHFSRCGGATQLGPGRHPVSSAYFWYFKCPAGGLIEYYADDDELTEDWVPRSFEPGPTVFAEWAIDGGIDGHTRRQKGVAADGKFLSDKR